MNGSQVSEKTKILNFLRGIAPLVFSSSMISSFDAKLSGIDAKALLGLSNKLSYFYKSLEENTECTYTLRRIRDSPFFNKFLKLIIGKSYNDNTISLIDSLSTFFKAIIDLWGGIEDVIVRWDTPAGPPSRQYAYDELKPTLSSIDGIYYIEGLDYLWLNKELSKSLSDNGLTVNAAIFSKMHDMGLFRFSRPSVNSLTLDKIVQILRNNFRKEGAKTFGALKALTKEYEIEGLEIRDFLFDFLEESEAKAVDKLYDLKINGLEIDLEWFTDGIYSFRYADKQNVLFNYDKHVIGLRLRNSNIEQVPEGVYNLKELKILDLSFNKLKEISKSIGKLNDLEILYLNYNLLTKLPTSLGNLRSLKELHLNNNQLTTIPNSLGNLSNLNQLYINGNKLVEVPQFIKKIPSLKTFLTD